MRIDRPSSRPEDSDERPSRPSEDARPGASELLDDNGLNPAEYIAAWNKKVESGEADKEEAAAEQPRRDPVMRDANGMTAAELRFQRNKRIEAESSETPSGNGDASPEVRRDFRTVTEELGESKSWHSFPAAKRVIRARLGHETGVEVDHIVEQCQSDPKRSGFSVEKINSSDNMTRLDKSAHQEKTSEFASNTEREAEGKART